MIRYPLCICLLYNYLYILHLKYADEHVPGSPFVVNVTGEPSYGRMTQQVTQRREAADISQVGSTCELSLKIPGTIPYFTVHIGVCFQRIML